MQKINIIDSQAIETRLNINQNSLKNFDEWSVSIFPKLSFGSKILDLGCGTGKQILLFAKFLTDKFTFYALDISEESLKKLQKVYNCLPKLNLINGSFDELKRYFIENEIFDLIYSFYALYYTQKLEEVVCCAFDLLKKGGIFWIVGPFVGTNRELFEIIEKYYQIDEKILYSLWNFYYDLQNAAYKAGFNKIEFDFFENVVFFEKIEKIKNYYRNTTFYSEKYEKLIMLDIEKVFEKRGIFQLTKNVISIKFFKNGPQND